MKNNEIIQLVSSTKTTYRATHSNFDKYLNQYNGKYDTKSDDKRSNVFVKKTMAIINRKVSSCYDTFLSGDGIINIIGDNQEYINIVNKAINYYEKKYLSRAELIQVFNDFYIYGIGIVRLFWNDGVVVERIDPREFCFDLNANNINDSQYYIHTYKVSYDVISSYNLTKLNYHGKGYKNNIFNRYEVDDLYYIEDGKYYVASIHNGVVFRNVQIQNIPFAFGYARPKTKNPNDTNDNFVYGESECEVLSEYQNELNEIRNQQRDAVRSNLNPIVIAEKGSGINAYDYYNAGPGEVVYTDNNSGITFAPTPPLVQANQELKNIDIEIQELSGVTAYNSGVSRAGMLNQTATGMSILTSEGNTRIASEIRVIYETFFVPFCKLYTNFVINHAPTRLLKKFASTDMFIFDRYDTDFEVKEINIEKAGQNTELKKQRLLEAMKYMQNSPKGLQILQDELLPLIVDRNTINKVQGDTNATI